MKKVEYEIKGCLQCPYLGSDPSWPKQYCFWPTDLWLINKPETTLFQRIFVQVDYDYMDENNSTTPQWCKLGDKGE